jgi:acyl carrier protein
MSHDEALKRLQEVFDRLFLEPVKLTSMLRAKDVPEWDSLMQVNLVIAVEKAFGVRFRLGEVEKTKNIGEFVELILRRMEPS